MWSTPMVDRPARDRAAELLRQLVAGRTGLETYEDAIREVCRASTDPAIRRVAVVPLWGVLEEGGDDRLVGERALSPTDRHLLKRAVLFLKTDLPYEWSEDGCLDQLAFGCADLLTLGLASWFAERFARGPNVDLWPFAYPVDYARVLQCPPYLNGPQTLGPYRRS